MTDLSRRTIIKSTGAIGAAMLPATQTEKMARADSHGLFARFAGLPASSWAFALRIWVAVMMALYAGFWLELDAPSSAGVAIAIVAMPTRGQGMEKAGFLLLATVLGVAASIVIAGFFSQTSGLLLAVFGVWIGLCVYAACMLDGNRAFAAALCSVTVALVAIQQIDSPQLVFRTAIARGAAIAVGVFVVALVNDVLAVPDYYPVLSARLEELHRQVMSYVEGVVRGEATSARAAAGLLRDVAAVRSEIAGLATESSSGNARSAAARTAMVGLVTELFLARGLAALRVAAAPALYPRDPDGSSGLMTIGRAWLRQELIGKNADVLGSLDALRAGTYPLRQWRAPLYRSRRIAAESGVRAAIHFTLIAILFVMAGWPATEISLYFAAFIIALSSIAPDARMLTAAAIAAMPIACLLAGILKYFVFNGVSEFPLLAIGLAPVVIGSALLMTMPSRSWLGRLILIFTLTVFDAANPQNYDPRVYLVTSFFVCLAAILSFAAHLLIPPLSNDRRLQLLLDETRRDLSNLDAQPHPHATPEEAAFHDATRIERIVTASGPSLSYRQVVDEAMYCFDRAASLRQGYAELDRLATGPLAGAAYTARRALAQRDRSVILTAAEALRKAAAQHGVTADSACAALALASVAFAPAQSAPQSANREQP
jgi:uncharacterized membrane protein YccC